MERLTKWLLEAVLLLAIGAKSNGRIDAIKYSLEINPAFVEMKNMVRFKPIIPKYLCVNKVFNQIIC